THHCRPNPRTFMPGAPNVLCPAHIVCVLGHGFGPRGQKMPNMSTVAKEVSYFSARSERKWAQNQFI
ncbi:hypothetical protein, partial [Collinsella aerofaciens]|uniref:hypothetical protein n=1 Tax=Collinsella aerofaciens TaxID=74426 RepID=UPI0035694BF7